MLGVSVTNYSNKNTNIVPLIPKQKEIYFKNYYDSIYSIGLECIGLDRSTYLYVPKTVGLS